MANKGQPSKVDIDWHVDRSRPVILLRHHRVSFLLITASDKQQLHRSVAHIFSSHIITQHTMVALVRNALRTRACPTAAATTSRGNARTSCPRAAPSSGSNGASMMRLLGSMQRPQSLFARSKVCRPVREHVYTTRCASSTQDVPVEFLEMPDNRLPVTVITGFLGY